MIVATHLVHMIEKKSMLLGERWAEEVMENKLTPHYAQLTVEELSRRAMNVYSSLGRWLDKRFTSDEARKTYFSLGRRRFKEGFDVAEMVVAVSLEKRVLFDCIEEEGLLDSAYNLHAVLQLMMELTRFFDKAITHSVLGYEHQRRIGDGGRPAIHPTGVWFPVSSPRSDDDHH